MNHEYLFRNGEVAELVTSTEVSGELKSGRMII